MFIKKSEYKKLKLFADYLPVYRHIENIICEQNCKSQQQGCDFTEGCVNSFCKKFNIPTKYKGD